MTRGQIVSLLTIGVAIAISSAAVTLGLTILLFRPLYIHIILAAAPDLDRMSPLALAVFVASAGLAASWMLMIGQQSIIRWLADREASRLATLYNEINVANGSDAAREAVLSRLQARSQPFLWDPFDGATVQRVMNATGIKRT